MEKINFLVILVDYYQVNLIFFYLKSLGNEIILLRDSIENRNIKQIKILYQFIVISFARPIKKIRTELYRKGLSKRVVRSPTTSSNLSLECL